MTSLFPNFLAILRGLESASKKVSEPTLRIGSGLRINQASDDPAGLALASRLEADHRVYSQAARNVSEGISYLNVADGGAAELKNVLLRLKELSTQAANGSYTSTQRQALDTEGQALVAEYNRIATTTEYNGNKLFLPSPPSLTVQAGYGPEAAITVALSGGTFTTTATSTTGDGTFKAAVSYAAGDRPYSPLAADFNGDGKLDLVNSSSQLGVFEINVFLGNGDGSFQTRVSYASGELSSSISAADLNGDGKLDLVVESFDDNVVSVFLGNGNGTFQTRTSYVTGINAQENRLADVNGDGKLDVVTADGGDTVSVLLGNGDGSLRARVSYAAGDFSFGLKLLDLNGDGKMEIVNVSEADGKVSVFLGNGDGTFAARISYDAGATDGVLGPIQLATADLNGDGKTDLLSVDSFDGTLNVLFGNGNGSFQSRISYASGSGVHDLSDPADVNGDGKLDVVTASPTDGRISVFLGNGDGSFRARVSYSAGTNPWSVALADLNADGALDIVVDVEADDTFHVLLGNPTTTTTTTTTSIAVATLSGVSLLTQASASAAQATVDIHLTAVEGVASLIGAGLGRFEVAAGHAARLADSYAIAEAQIRDADLAEETAKLVRNQVLQQAGVALMAHGRFNVSVVLSLLDSDA